MKKIIFFTFILVLLVVSGCVKKGGNEVIMSEEKNGSEQPLLGGDRDEHGCIVSAGYTWCEAKQKCIRPWEEECEIEVVTTNENRDWKPYKNEKFGFELKFPKSWDGHNVIEADYPIYSYAAFSFSNGHQPFSIFSIIQYSKEKWETTGKNPLLRVLSQTDETVLVCDGCCDEGGDTTGGGEFDEFQIERCKEVPEIIKTFKITN